MGEKLLEIKGISEQKLEEIKRTQKTSSSSADELKKYKELLDMGAITPEEYEKRKNNY